jgi:DNA polymerase III subunit alpha
MKVKNSTWKIKRQTFLGLECSPQRSNGCLQKQANEAVMKVAKVMKGPLLMTLDSHFVAPEDKFRQDIVLMGSARPWQFFTNYHQLSLQDAWKSWQARHGEDTKSANQFAEAVENNQTVVDMVEPVSFKKELHMAEPELPIDIVNSDRTRDQKIEDYVMRLIAKHGRLPEGADRPKYLSRLKSELDVIARNPTVNFLPYFLVLHDVCKYARDNNIMTGPGRGSAAGSLLSYLLKITHLDPILFGLSFARFLSLGRIARGKFPDIDLDFGDPKAIVEWMKEKHGDRFARICTTGTMKLKGAIRDVSRALLDTKANKDKAELVEAVCKSLPKSQTNSNSREYLYGWQNEEGAHPGMIDVSPTLKKFLEDHPSVKEGLDGRHASAYCLSDVDINTLLPMCLLGTADDSEVCTQFTMNPVEALGLLKMDFLGVNTLNDIQGALNLIKQRTGVDIDPYNFDQLPIDDPEVYQEFCQGHTESTFQFKTEIATKLCMQVRPTDLNALSAITANGRPGTMYSLMEDGKTTLIQAWVARRQGEEPVTYLHSELEEILEETQGIFCYQEQLLSAFKKCCGYTEEQADEIREAVGKKKIDQMAKFLPEIEERLYCRGWSETQVPSFISAFRAAAGYSFNKSHSCSYAYLGYICGWLKYHYPLEWWTSVMQNSTPDDLKANAHSCKDFVVSPDINRSDMDFYIIDGKREKIVYPLGMVKRVKKAGVDIVGKKPFSSLEDFYSRVDRRVVNKGVMASLIWSGAFDRLCNVFRPEDRNFVYREYLALRGDVKPDKYPPLLNEFEILLNQNEALPLNAANFSELIEQESGRKVLSYEEALALPDKRLCLVAGVVTRVNPYTPKKTAAKPNPKAMCFLEISDKSTKIDITVFNDVYEARKSRLTVGTALLVEAKVNNYNGKRGLVAENVTAYGVTIPTDENLDLEGDV